MFYESSILTVVTPATDYGLVDLATVKDELEIADTTSDVRLKRWIRDATDAIQSVIGRVLRAETVTEAFRGSLHYRDAPGEHFYPRGMEQQRPTSGGLQLRRYPVVDVTAIIEDDTTLDPGVDYEIHADRGILYRLSGFSRLIWSSQRVQVTYRGGYATIDDVPGDLQAACLTLLKHRRAAQTRDPMLRSLTIPGVIQRQFWVGAPGESPGLPPEVLGMISHYRDARF